MQNLRDKLLKAGIVDKKAKKQADHQARQQRAEQGGHKIAQDAEAKRQAAWEQQLAAQRERDQAIEAERRAAREARELLLRAQQRIDYYSAKPQRGPRRWYFMARGQKIRAFSISEEEARRLERGQLAIVERGGAGDGDDDGGGYAVIPAEVARDVWAVDPTPIRFFNRDWEAMPARWWEVEQSSRGEAPPGASLAEAAEAEA